VSSFGGRPVSPSGLPAISPTRAHKGENTGGSPLSLSGRDAAEHETLKWMRRPCHILSPLAGPCGGDGGQARGGIAITPVPSVQLP